MWTRRRTISKPGVGAMLIVSSRWRPETIRQLWFRADEDSTPVLVPPSRCDRVLAATSTEQVMAILRAPELP